MNPARSIPVSHTGFCVFFGGEGGKERKKSMDKGVASLAGRQATPTCYFLLRLNVPVKGKGKGEERGREGRRSGVQGEARRRFSSRS